ncbi:hypothetical protein [Emticicia sp. 17c]|uniref:hypothetical protein n=1 Tax=Emticicia sp. 17c TaxID=3127704 RepID=UPI00301BACCE
MIYVKVGIVLFTLLLYIIRQIHNSRVLNQAKKFNPQDSDDIKAIAAELDFPVREIKFKANHVLKVLDQIDYEIELDFITLRSLKKFDINKYLAITVAKLEKDENNYDYSSDYKRINFVLVYYPDTNSIKYYSYSYQNVDDGYVMDEFSYKFSEYIESFEF